MNIDDKRDTNRVRVGDWIGELRAWGPTRPLCSVCFSELLLNQINCGLAVESASLAAMPLDFCGG